MAVTKITVPDFEFSGFYYPDIVRRLRTFNRLNAPEITSEVPEEPFIQLERAFGLVGHLNNVLLDLAANECLLPTLRLQDSARKLLALIDFDLRDYSPASVELLAKLRQVLTSSQTILDANSVFQTNRTDESPAVPFENVDTAITIGPTNVIDGAYGLGFVRQGADGVTVLGSSNLFESASASFSQNDVGRVIEIRDSILGNNNALRIAEVQSATRARLTAILGGEDPLFISENNLTWIIRGFGADGSAELNGPGTFTPWAAGPYNGDTVYFASKYVMPSKFDLIFDTDAAGVSGVWEYYDPDLLDENPDLVTVNPSSLTFNLNTLLGTDDRNGAFVVVTYLPTNQSETLVSAYVGGNNQITTSAFLGQSGTPSDDIEDYAVGTYWNPLPDQEDKTEDMTKDGEVTFDLPQTARRNWQQTTVQSVTGYWFRYRVVSSVVPTKPVLDSIDITSGDQFILINATQGETVENESLKSSNGLPNQKFALAQTPGLKTTVQCYIDEGGGEVAWLNMTALDKSLLLSESTDRHFVVEQDATGTLTACFGDGTYGKIPPLGVNTIRFVYRIKATDEGNVGTDMITNNSEGAAFLKTITNPRPAYGWREADGASEESLALVKEQGPASLRTLERAVSPSDYEDLAINWQTSAGTRPIIRAKSVEEGFGPKTIKLVVVGTSGTQINSAIKSALETYFNGDPANGLEGVGQANTQVTVVNYTPRQIALTIIVEANAALTDTLIRTRMSTLINPSAQESDGTTYVWRFGGRVPLSRIAAEVFSISPGNVFDVDVTNPAEDIELTNDELPLLNSSGLTISIVPPTV